MATRPVRFCGVCGARVPVNSLTYALDIAYCGAHDDVPSLDAIPPDPLTCLPVQADELPQPTTFPTPARGPSSARGKAR